MISEPEPESLKGGSEARGRRAAEAERVRAPEAGGNQGAGLGSRAVAVESQSTVFALPQRPTLNPESSTLNSPKRPKPFKASEGVPHCAGPFLDLTLKAGRIG